MARHLHILLLALLLPGCPIVSEDDLTLRKDADGDGFGLEDDCDDNDPDVGEAETWYLDADGDGWTTHDTHVACEDPGGLIDASDQVDCDDERDDVHPDAPELCDGVDNDCDGEIDEERVTLYLDQDGDGHGDELVEKSACFDDQTDLDGMATVNGDCDDERADVYPDAPTDREDTVVCDDRDFDCDGVVDYDADGDGCSSQLCGGSDPDDGHASDNCAPSFDWVDGDYDDNLDGYVGEHRITDDSPRLEGTTQDWEFGSSVSLSGDLDGDGDKDLILGAHYADWEPGDGSDIHVNAGAVYVMYGPLTLPADGVIHPEDSSAVLLWGQQGTREDCEGEGDQLGTQVLVHDFTGGDTDDLIMVARREDWPDGSQDEDNCVGAAHMIHGTALEDPDLDDAYTDWQSISYTSWYGVSDVRSLSAVFAGDLNADGPDDILLGTTGDSGGENYGSIHFVPGPIVASDPQRLDGSTDLLLGEYSGDNIGSPDRACVLDFDNDGMKDLAVGSTNAPRPEGEITGGVWFLEGPVFDAGDGNAPFTPSERGVLISGEEDDHGVGDRISPAGDVNEDGYDDLLVMGTITDDGCGGCGSIYLVFGQDLEEDATLETAGIAMEISGEHENVGLGRFAVSAGNVDDAGGPDLLLGGVSAFYVFVDGLSPDGGTLTTAQADGVIPMDVADFVASDQLPFPAIGGDLNDDPIDDFAIADPKWDNGAGRVYLFFGSEI